MYKVHSKNFKTTKIKNMRRHGQKQINDMKEEVIKHQNETKDTIKEEVCKKTTQNIKEELNKHMEKTSEKRIKQKSWKKRSL
jgi:hypothetical protein